MQFHLKMSGMWFWMGICVSLQSPNRTLTSCFFGERWNYLKIRVYIENGSISHWNEEKINVKKGRKAEGTCKFQGRELNFAKLFFFGGGVTTKLLMIHSFSFKPSHGKNRKLFGQSKKVVCVCFFWKIPVISSTRSSKYILIYAQKLYLGFLFHISKKYRILIASSTIGDLKRCTNEVASPAPAAVFPTAAGVRSPSEICGFF